MSSVLLSQVNWEVAMCLKCVLQGTHTKITCILGRGTLYIGERGRRALLRCTFLGLTPQNYEWESLVMSARSLNFQYIPRFHNNYFLESVWWRSTWGHLFILRLKQLWKDFREEINDLGEKDFIIKKLNMYRIDCMKSWLWFINIWKVQIQMIESKCFIQVPDGISRNNDEMT